MPKRKTNSVSAFREAVASCKPTNSKRFFDVLPEDQQEALLEEVRKHRNGTQNASVAAIHQLAKDHFGLNVAVSTFRDWFRLVKV